MRVTAYCPCDKCCGVYGWKYTTASGHKIKGNEKLVAAPKSMKFGTLLLIPGYNNVPVKVLDRGGAIKGNRIDVYFPTHKQAIKWGVRYIDVKEVSNGQ
jgi:3D (Asp-Asp-Asp) domain-containing protein